MPKQPKLPPRDPLTGKFLKNIPSSQPPAPSDSLLDPSIREREPSPSSSTLSNPIEDISSDTISTPRLSLVFPKTIRHSIPGSFSPLDSPSDTSAPVSTLVSKRLASPSLIPIPVTRTPSPVSLSCAPLESSSSSASSDSSSSASSSQTVTLALRSSSTVLPVNFRASQFLSTRPNPPQSQTSLDPTSSSQASSASIVPHTSSSSLVPTQPSTSQSPDTTTVSASTQASTLRLPAPSTSPVNLPPPPAPSAPPTAPPTQPVNPPVPPTPPVAPLAPLIQPAPLAPPAPVIMAANPPTGPAAMPSARERRAPFFSGRVGDPLDEFLREYEELATTYALTPQQKVETILRYIPHDLRELWKILEGYPTHNWALFRQSLECIYEGTLAQSRHSKQKLYDFAHYNSRSRMRDEEDVMGYYRQFLVFCEPLIEANRITTDERDYAFWYGFHPDDQEKLSPRLLAKFPDQPIRQPYSFSEVFKIARAVFSSSPFFPFQLQERWDHLANHEKSLGQGFGPSIRDPRGLDQEARGRGRAPFFDFNSRNTYARPDYARPDWDLGRGHSTQHHLANAHATEPLYARAPDPQIYTRTLPDHYTHAPDPHASDPYNRPPETYARAPEPPHPRTHAPGPSVETKTVRFKEPTREEEDRELEDLMDKMHGLSMRERSYAVLYARLAHRYPDVARNVPKPELTQPSYAFQTPSTPTSSSRQPWTERSVPAPPPAVSSDSSFFRSRAMSCAFCSQTNHRIRECPIAQEYVRLGRAVVINDRIHLPNGQPIPNNVPGANLQTKINTWMARNMADTADPSPFIHDPPPHAANSFEIVPEGTYSQAVQQAHIVEVPTVDEPESGSNEVGEDAHDLFETYATQKKKRDAKASQLPELAQTSKSTTLTTAPSSKVSPSKTPASTNPTSKTSATTPIPSDTPHPSSNNMPAPAPVTTPSPSSSTSPRAAPQYHYQSNAEDQRLTTELYQWLLDGKLSLVTPAHVLAASPFIRKELIERLRTRRVDAANFEEPASSSSIPPSTVLELSTPRTAEYSLPLHEIDILINGIVSEAGVLDQGSQIVVIRKDLAQEAGVFINHDHRLEMEGANGLVSKTLGCAENLLMQVGDVSFEVHAHVVDHAPFRLLLGRPFHHLLLCRLEDHPDGRVDVSVRDPADPARSISIPSRARKAQVGFCYIVTTLARLELYRGGNNLADALKTWRSRRDKCLEDTKVQA
ncbi:hypothetical protein H4582DRAFT_2088124 [Lactarius indigo]|nr:hypothetical protein H4582DRAFT_2088124 [Lactarius indigo]